MPDKDLAKRPKIITTPGCTPKPEVWDSGIQKNRMARGNNFFTLITGQLMMKKNRTYQPKLSPKWISEDGRKMVLIWSDAMMNEEGRSHTINYLWNQMEITLQTTSHVLPGREAIGRGSTDDR